MRNVDVNRDHEYVSETRICVNTILGDRQPKAVFFFLSEAPEFYLWSSIRPFILTQSQP